MFHIYTSSNYCFNTRFSSFISLDTWKKMPKRFFANEEEQFLEIFKIFSQIEEKRVRHTRFRVPKID